MGTYTPGNLYKPADNETGWGDEVDLNFDRLDELVFNVKAFGAVGDGSSDDSSAVQSAITAAAAATRGGTVLLPAGKYKCSGLTAPRGITLCGTGAPVAYSADYGTVLIPTGNDTTIIDIDDTAALTQGGLVLRDLVFASNNLTGCTGVNVVNRNRVNLANCGFIDLAVGLDLEMATGGDSSWHTLVGCWFYNNTIGVKHYGYGFAMVGGDVICQASDTGIQLIATASAATQNARLVGVKFDGGTCIDCQGGFNQIIGCDFEAATLGIYIWHPSGAQGVSGSRNMVQAPIFSSCTTDIKIGESAYDPSCFDNMILGYGESGTTNGIVDNFNGERNTIVSNLATRLVGGKFPGGVATKTKTSAPADADWEVVPPNGTMVVDTTATPKRLYVRVGTDNWDYVELT